MCWMICAELHRAAGRHRELHEEAVATLLMVVAPS